MAAHCFGGNLEHSRAASSERRAWCRACSAAPGSAGGCTRWRVAYTLYHQLGLALEEMSPSTKYLLDSFPVPACDNICIGRARLPRGAQWRGRRASHRRYFYGVKVQVVTTEEGVPVEFAFLPGAASDTRGLDVLPLALPQGSKLFMGSGYTDYATEDVA